MVGIGQNVQDILQNTEEVLLEKRVRNITFRICKVHDDLEAHCWGGGEGKVAVSNQPKATTKRTDDSNRYLRYLA